MVISLSVSLNGKQGTLHGTNYNYKAYLEKLLIYGSDASVTYLVSSFCYLDYPGELKGNSGCAKRLNYLSNGKTLEVWGRPHADLFISDNMLINGLDMNIKLTLHHKLFISWPFRR